MDQGCRRMILIAPGWPTMPWFWDLVNLSLQIPFQLPLPRNLLTQPFNGLVHRNLSNLNLHAWLLEPLPFMNKGSLRKWQQELKLLGDSQPEPCANQMGHFCQVVRLPQGGLQVALCEPDCGFSFASVQREKTPA